MSKKPQIVQCLIFFNTGCGVVTFRNCVSMSHTARLWYRDFYVISVLTHVLSTKEGRSNRMATSCWKECYDELHSGKMWLSWWPAFWRFPFSILWAEGFLHRALLAVPRLRAYSPCAFTLYRHKSESIFLSNAPRLPKEPLESSQISPVCPSGKSNMQMKVSMERWWNDIDGETEVLGETSVSLSPQISHRLVWNRICDHCSERLSVTIDAT